MTETVALCQCGCGGLVRLAQQTDSRLGKIKGRPQRFLLGHRARLARKSWEEKFWGDVVPEPNTGCWLWAGEVNNKGYGVVSRGRGHRMYAHRLSYSLNIGPIPDGMQVLHRCDTPPCVNPNHLRLGTHRENLAEAASKLRFSQAKLSPGAVIQIRDLAGAVTQTELARRFGVSQSCIWYVLKAETWKHIQGGNR